jgi:hypothetical protein
MQFFTWELPKFRKASRLTIAPTLTIAASILDLEDRLNLYGSASAGDGEPAM